MAPRSTIALWSATCFGLAALALADTRGWQRYRKLRAQVEDLTERNATATRENRRLQREARALKENPAAIERAARAELGLIRPGEIVLQLNAGAAAPP